MASDVDHVYLASTQHKERDETVPEGAWRSMPVIYKGSLKRIFNSKL